MLDENGSFILYWVVAVVFFILLLLTLAENKKNETKKDTYREQIETELDEYYKNTEDKFYTAALI